MDDSKRGDGFKWFGEGFDGFPKRLPDDCVEYVVYCIDAQLKTAAATRTRLNQILKASNDLKKKHLKEYIWQRDSFELKLHPQIGSEKSNDEKISHEAPKGLLHLRGRTNFGDSVADEWLIVYLLLELSKSCQDAWIRLYDTDGEFLLIEAANALPKWLNPDIAENRVWINNGHLRLIPLKEGATSNNLSIQDALSSIQTQSDKLIISPFVEDEAFHRVRGYPAGIASSLHHAHTTIPRRLASVLHHDPSYISSAIEAFYLRDPIALRPLATKDLFTLHFPPEDFVTVSVKFTKVGYAQLRGQAFDSPPAWTAVKPRMEDDKVSIGMKLTCGFEMLLSDPQTRSKRTAHEIQLLLSEIASGDETLPTDAELAAWPQTQDDEKWLDIDYRDFEDELAGKNKGKAAKDGGRSGEGFGDADAQQNLRKMVSRFEDFLKDDEAGIDGVDDRDDPDDDDESSAATTDSEDAPEQPTSNKPSSTSSKPSPTSTSTSTKPPPTEVAADFEASMSSTRAMSAADVEASGLLAEARRLALEDAEQAESEDEDEEMRKVMELMEKELKGHGALGAEGKKGKDGTKEEESVCGEANGKGKEKAKAGGKCEGKKVTFGPPRPPGTATGNAGTVTTKANAGDESADEELFGDGELSSDDDGDEYNDVDLGLAKNMLEAFKGQAGAAGPAGNLMKAMGVGMPRDENGEEAEGQAGSSRR